MGDNVIDQLFSSSPFIECLYVSDFHHLHKLELVATSTNYLEMRYSVAATCDTITSPLQILIK